METLPHSLSERVDMLIQAGKIPLVWGSPHLWATPTSLAARALAAEVEALERAVRELAAAVETLESAVREIELEARTLSAK